MLDVFSRYVVAWWVEEREDGALAKAFQTTFARHWMRPIVVHSDSGPSMTSSVVKELFADLGIVAAQNRPRASDNDPTQKFGSKTAKCEPADNTTYRPLAGGLGAGERPVFG